MDEDPRLNDRFEGEGRVIFGNTFRKGPELTPFSSALTTTTDAALPTAA